MIIISTVRSHHNVAQWINYLTVRLLWPLLVFSPSRPSFHHLLSVNFLSKHPFCYYSPAGLTHRQFEWDRFAVILFDAVLPMSIVHRYQNTLVSADEFANSPILYQDSLIAIWQIHPLQISSHPRFNNCQKNPIKRLMSTSINSVSN